MAPGSVSASDLAAATPAERDRWIDLLRAVSIAVVILGHWLVAVVVWEDGTVDGFNALERIPGLWPLTWVLQVMPLFFFVGGFSNLVSLRSAHRRGEGYAGFLQGRFARLLRPTVAFLASAGAPISRVTWAAYVSRGQAPAADRMFGRSPAWRPATIREWQASRPRRGSKETAPDISLPPS